MYFVVLVTNVIVSLLAKASCVARSTDRFTAVYIKYSSLPPMRLRSLLTNSSVLMYQNIPRTDFMD